jgi:hypothetical protein
VRTEESSVAQQLYEHLTVSKDTPSSNLLDALRVAFIGATSGVNSPRQGDLLGRGPVGSANIWHSN